MSFRASAMPSKLARTSSGTPPGLPTISSARARATFHLAKAPSARELLGHLPPPGPSRGHHGLLERAGARRPRQLIAKSDDVWPKDKGHSLASRPPGPQLDSESTASVGAGEQAPSGTSWTTSSSRRTLRRRAQPTSPRRSTATSPRCPAPSVSWWLPAESYGSPRLVVSLIAESRGTHLSCRRPVDGFVGHPSAEAVDLKSDRRQVAQRYP